MKRRQWCVGAAAVLGWPLAAWASGPATSNHDLPQRSKALVQPPRSRPFKPRLLAEGLNHPWSLAPLPDGRMWVTERSGTLRLLDAQGRTLLPAVAGLPAVKVEGQAGLFDVVLHPQHERNGWMYLAYAEPDAADPSLFGTALARGRVKDGRWTDHQLLFSMKPKSKRAFHLGGRVLFDRQGLVYLTLGDRGEMARAQAPNDHAGSVIRLHDDGRVPADNPYVGRSDVPPEVFSRGHRNIQGAAFHPVTGDLWTHEHGPQGGDELNLTRPGRNHGWPTITYGVQYGSGAPIGEGTHKDGLEQPVHVWVPSLGISGLCVVQGDTYSGWNGSLLLGGLSGQVLVRLELEGQKVVREERLLERELGRIRDVRQAPDGRVLLLTDAPNGQLWRLEPA